MTAEPFSQAAIDYNRIEEAIEYLIDNFHAQPGLREIAARIHMSEYHFQRLCRYQPQTVSAVFNQRARQEVTGKVHKSLRRYLRSGPDQPRTPARSVCQL
ncbi:MAG: hypothetical protein PVG00_17335 [Desulfobacterales bacterium]|jgi:AraC-like DNA-binding protein